MTENKDIQQLTESLCNILNEFFEKERLAREEEDFNPLEYTIAIQCDDPGMDTTYLSRSFTIGKRNSKGYPPFAILVRGPVRAWTYGNDAFEIQISQEDNRPPCAHLFYLTKEVKRIYSMRYKLTDEEEWHEPVVMYEREEDDGTEDSA